MSYKDEQKRTRDALKPKLMEGYEFNSVWNRERRRKAGYRRPINFKNVQTYVKPGFEKAA